MPKKTTIDELAQMVAEGFKHTATKDELDLLREEMRAGFKTVNNRLDHIEEDMADIRNVILADHLKRIERVEAEVSLLKQQR